MNHLVSDGDSDGADPEANLNHLSGNQLRGNAELIGRKMTADGEVVMYTAGVINQEELEIDPKSVAGTSTAESHQVGKKPPTGISRTPQKRNKSAHSSGQKLCSPVDRVDNIPSILDSGTLSTEAEHSTDGPRSVDHQTLTLQDEEGIRAAKRQRTELRESG